LLSGRKDPAAALEELQTIKPYPHHRAATLGGRASVHTSKSDTANEDDAQSKTSARKAKKSRKVRKDKKEKTVKKEKQDNNKKKKKKKEKRQNQDSLYDIATESLAKGDAGARSGTGDRAKSSRDNREQRHKDRSASSMKEPEKASPTFSSSPSSSSSSSSSGIFSLIFGGSAGATGYVPSYDQVEAS
jgi:hypothetical protein